MMTEIRTIFRVALASLAVGAASANTVDALVAELKGADEAARVHARQMLPREGIDALPALLPLINDESEDVWRAAYNVVADIANAACAPGRDDERKKATDLLISWLAPDQPPRAREYGLRLIRYIVPEGYPADAIAPYLQHSDLREYARGALEVIATNEARLALEAALANADTPFKVALIESLEKIGSDLTLPLFTAAMDDADPQIGAAAARAAAQFGQPAMATKFMGLSASATTETMFETTDAVLRYADALARSGGNWTLAMKTYIGVLEESNDPVLVSGALMGLGRYGDENVVPVVIAKAAESESREVRGALPMALASLTGKAATEAIIAGFTAIPQPARPAVLKALGRNGQPGAIPLVQEALAHADPAYRNAGIDAAVSLGSAELLAPLMALAEHGEDVERPEALHAALSIAAAGNAAGSSAEAGAALVKLYSYAEADTARAEILAALARNPVAEALPLAKEAVESPELKDAATSLLVAMVPTLIAAGDPSAAHEVVAAVVATNGSAQELVAMAAGLGASADELRLPAMLGVLQRWRLIGPFTWTDDDDWDRAFVNEPNVDVGATLDGKSWTDVSTSDPLGLVDLSAHFGALDHVFAYAYTTIEVPTACDGQLRMGSDDGIVAWVNGNKVWENRVDRGLRVDEDVAPVSLQSGTNTIMLKISQGSGGWNFCCRVTDDAGMAVAQR